MKLEDNWIEDRIRWKARRHNLPAGRTRFLSATDPTSRSAVAAFAEVQDCGTGVLLAYESVECWTLIGTRQTVGVADGRIRSFDHEDIASIRAKEYPPETPNWQLLPMDEIARMKHSWQTLVLSNKSGREESFWVPAGSEAFAIWNVLLMLARLFI